jgi:RNA polymerase sigma-70 factor (ECF subfamily)
MAMPDLQTGVLATSDEDLVAQSRGGNSAAREELFRRHFGVAYRVAHRLLGHEQDALDALQDGFLKAVLHLDEFDGRSGFRTWLLRVVTNAALDLGRRRRRRLSLSLDHFASEESGQNGTAKGLGPQDPAAGLVRDDLRTLLNAALDQLSPNIRTTFVLFAEAELSYKEIADCQNVPIGTVMSRIHYARQKLQGRMRELDVLG